MNLWTGRHTPPSPPRQTRLRNVKRSFALKPSLQGDRVRHDTKNILLRLIHHAKGEVTATKFRRPFKLIHYEYFIHEKDAKAREEFLKSGFGRKQLKEALKRTINQLEMSSRNP